MTKEARFQFQRISYIFIIVALVLLFVSPFIIPIVMAGTIALALYPFQRYLVIHGWQKRYAAAFVTTMFTVVISVPFMIFISKGSQILTEQLKKFAVGERLRDEGLQSVVNTLRHDIVAWTQRVMDKLPVNNLLTEEKITEHLKAVNLFLLNFFQDLATNIPAAVMFFLIMLICTFSFLKYASGIRDFFQSLFGFSDKKMDQLVGIFLQDARQVYVSNVITGIIQSTIVAFSVYFISKADWFLVFFVTLIFSFIPVIGAAPMAFLFAVVMFFQDNNTGAIILFAVGCFTGVIDNLLRPWLASFGESKAPPIVSFICVIGGALLLGVPGLFIGLLVGSLSYDTLPLFWNELGKPSLFSGFKPDP